MSNIIDLSVEIKKYGKEKVRRMTERMYEEQRKENDKVTQEYLESIYGKKDAKKHIIALKWSSAHFNEAKENLKLLGYYVINEEDYRRTEELASAASVCHTAHELNINKQAFALLIILSTIQPLRVNYWHSTKFGDLEENLKRTILPSLIKCPISRSKVKTTINKNEAILSRITDKTRKDRINKVLTDISLNNDAIHKAITRLENKGIIFFKKSETISQSRPPEILHIDTFPIADSAITKDTTPDKIRQDFTDALLSAYELYVE